MLTRHFIRWSLIAVSTLTAGCAGDTSTTAPPPVDDAAEVLILSPGAVTVTDVTITQAVRKPLVVDGQQVVDEVPIVGRRPALLRIFYDLKPGAADAEIETELVIADAAPIVTGHVLSGESLVSVLPSTLNIAIPATSLAMGNPGWNLTMKSGGEIIGRFPKTGTAPLEVTTDAIDIELVFVPIDYRPAGTIAVATSVVTAPAADAVIARFPVRDVTVSIGAPLVYEKQVDFASLEHWMDLVDAMLARRAADGAASHQFYIGLIDPGVEQPDWCLGTCFSSASPDALEAYDPHTHAMVTTSTSTTVSPRDVLPGIAEALDRSRVDCEDTNVWGYDLQTGVLYPPNDTIEMMSAGASCTGSPDLWIGTGTYRHLVDSLERVGAGP